MSHALPGLQYAQEISAEDGKKVHNYFCTLCDVLSEAFNFHLHYASSLHRTNVLVRKREKGDHMITREIT